MSVVMWRPGTRELTVDICHSLGQTEASHRLLPPRSLALLFSTKLAVNIRDFLLSIRYVAGELSIYPIVWNN